MFEDIIVQLDQMGVPYNEDYEAGTLTVEVASLDKVALIQVIQFANDSGMEFNIDESALTLMGAPQPEDLPIAPGTTEAGSPEELVDLQAGAMDKLF